MRSKWRTFREHLSPLLLLIVAALVIIGVVAYVVVSQEDNSEAKLFEFQAGDSKISNLRIFSNAISEDDDAHPFLVVELGLDLLEDSIKNNTYMPGRDQIQKYNYVVTEKGNISVAVWAVQDRYDYLYDPKKDLGSCIKDRDWSMSNESESERPDGDAPVMINIYPEFRDPKVSPCWVTLPSGENMGLLDSSSKHLILAQGQPVLLDEVNEGWKDARRVRLLWT